MKYIAIISLVIGCNQEYFDFDYFVINGKIKHKKTGEYVTTISSKTSKDNLFNQKQKTIKSWHKKNKSYIGLKLSNHTALKEVYE